MGVPYSVTVFFRESRPKIEAKSESKKPVRKNAKYRIERADKPVEIAKRVANTRSRNPLSARLLADRPVLANGIDGEAATKRPIRRPGLTVWAH